MSASVCRVLAAMTACGLVLGGCACFRRAPAPAPALVAAAAPTPAAAPAPVKTPAPVVVKVPVLVKEACVPKTLARAPKYPDTDAALRDAGGAADRYQLMAAGRLLRVQRLADLEKIVGGCR